MQLLLSDVTQMWPFLGQHDTLLNMDAEPQDEN